MSQKGTKMSKKLHSGPKGDRSGKKVGPGTPKTTPYPPFWVSFWHPGPSFSESFFDVFLEGDFFSPWVIFSGQGAQKASKMEPFWSLFEDGWDIENVCFTQVKPYFLRSREVPGANFFRTAFSECLRRGPGAHFCRFSMIWGALWGPLGLHLGSKSTTFCFVF